MAELNTGDGGGGKKRHGGKVRAKKTSTRIDMTPMVDLAFLLLTFFMLTTTFSKPQAMEITMPVPPAPDDPKPTEIPKEKAVTILITGGDSVYYYFGLADANNTPELVKSDYSKDGLRKMLLDRNRSLYGIIQELKGKAESREIEPKDYKKQVAEAKKEDKVGPVVLIKATERAKYKNMVDVLDEMAITGIARYAIVDPTPTELQMLETAKQ